MRLLPCPTCGPRGASLAKSGAYPNYEPHISGGYVPDYVCAKCKTRVKLTKAQWNLIPDLSLSDFNRLAKDYKAPQLSELPTKDLVGAGFSKDQARDLFAAGIVDVATTEALARG